MVRLDPKTIHELEELLEPLIEDERSRRSFLFSAFGNDTNILRRIIWSGAVATFIPHMIDELAKYGEITPGKQALCTLLEYARSQVGEDKKERFDKVLSVIKQGRIPIIPPLTIPPIPQVTPTNPRYSIIVISSIGDIPIISEQGIDYTQLCNFLKEEEWQQADRETIRVMLEVANQEEKGWLLNKDIEKLPDSDLKIINNLWVKHSNAHFGFSIQHEICCKLGGKPNQFKSIIFHKFCQKVGWYRNENYLEKYQNFTFKIDAPRGHLPTLRFPAFESDMNYKQAWQSCFISVLNRL